MALRSSTYREKATQLLSRIEARIDDDDIDAYASLVSDLCDDAEKLEEAEKLLTELKSAEIIQESYDYSEYERREMRRNIVMHVIPNTDWSTIDEAISMAKKVEDYVLGVDFVPPVENGES